MRAAFTRIFFTVSVSPQPHRLYGVLAPAKAMAEAPALERIPRHLQIRPSQAE